MKYCVQALERLLYKTTYYIEADSPEAAIALAQSGNVDYDDFSVQDDPGEWVQTLSVATEDGTEHTWTEPAAGVPGDDGGPTDEDLGYDYSDFPREEDL